jgi:decaprenyl-phosphate phosphoribosyltransferase
MIPVPASAAAAATVPVAGTGGNGTAYLRLFKFRYHLSYATVVFAALIFSGTPSIQLAGQLTVLYICFNLLLYAGIYACNDVADVDSDRRHPNKCDRPVASGAIPVAGALLFAGTTIGLGLAGAHYGFGRGMTRTFVAFLALNAVYSLVAREIPALDLIFNGLTHPLRFLMGVSLTGRETPALHLIVVLAVAMGVASLRRLVELEAPGAAARATLRRYTREQLLLVVLLGLATVAVAAAIDRLASPGFLAAIVPACVLLAVASLSASARRLLVAFWTR